MVSNLVVMSNSLDGLQLRVFGVGRRRGQRQRDRVDFGVLEGGL